MDETTQRNAAMVEQTTAASRALASEADELAALVAKFKVDDRASPAFAPAQSPSPRARPAARTARTGGGAALAARPAPDDWDEF
jgi:methyl-accepting chemotaxis protein